MPALLPYGMSEDEYRALTKDGKKAARKMAADEREGWTLADWMADESPAHWGSTAALNGIYGYRDYRPQAYWHSVLNAVEDVLNTYSEFLPLTIRQVFYRLVGAYGYPKTEDAYKDLAEKVTLARRSQRISFDDIRDDGATASEPPWQFDSVASYWEQQKRWAAQYRKFRQEGQTTYLELWCEAAGMVPQMEAVAHPLGIPVFTSGGFDSVTVKYDSARRIWNRLIEESRLTRIIHVGDHDPSGVSLFRNAVKDMDEFLQGWYEAAAGERRVWGILQATRAAITPEQIVRYGSIPNYGIVPSPPKYSDDRSWQWEGPSVQAEALRPDDLRAEIKKTISMFYDARQLLRVRQAERQERKQLVAQVGAILNGGTP